MADQASCPKGGWFTWSGLPQMACQQAAWWLCVLGMDWSGPLSMAAFVVLHLMMVPRPLVGGELRLIGISAVVGLCLDSALAWSGMVIYEGGPLIGLSPLWLVSIWAGFGATLRHSQSILMRGRVHATITGAVGGPLAYMGGTRLEALSVHGSMGYAAVGALWLLAMLTLERFVRAEERR